MRLRHISTGLVCLGVCGLASGFIVTRLHRSESSMRERFSKELDTTGSNWTSRDIHKGKLGWIASASRSDLGNTYVFEVEGLPDAIGVSVKLQNAPIWAVHYSFSGSPLRATNEPHLGEKDFPSERVHAIQPLALELANAYSRTID